MNGLTPARMGLLEAIFGFFEQHGYAPSIEEMCQMIGVSSLASAHRLLRFLCEFGYVEKDFYRSRSLEITRRGELAVRKVRKARRAARRELDRQAAEVTA